MKDGLLLSVLGWLAPWPLVSDEHHVFPRPPQSYQPTDRLYLSEHHSQDQWDHGVDAFYKGQFQKGEDICDANATKPRALARCSQRSTVGIILNFGCSGRIEHYKCNRLCRSLPIVVSIYNDK